MDRRMCGLIGFLLAQTGSADLEPLVASLRHRGPDGTGVLRWRPGGAASRDDGPCRVALGHTRLAILDLSPLGHQPMSTPDGRWHLVYNGEIYNHGELRTELEQEGCRFASRSDTEVVLHALATWGPERALPRLRGMFALALLDTQEGRLLLARDRFGIKPLYLCRWRDGLAFASEPGPLRALPGVDGELDAARAWDYLAEGLTDHGDRSLLAGIRQVPAGHWSMATVDAPAGLFDFRRHAQPAAVAPALSFADAADRLRHLLLDSVRCHLRSDVPVGTALSGGLDSSAIVCAIRHLEPDRPIHTFSYIADDPALSEARWATLVNEHVGAIAHPVSASPEALVEELDRLMAAQGEPFASTSIHAQACVFRAARQTGVPVLLDGQGADELLAGYPWHQGERLASLLRQGCWLRALRLLHAQAGWPGRSRREVLARALRRLLPGCARLARTSGRPSWARLGWFRERGVDPTTGHQPPAARETLRAALAWERDTCGLAQLLRYEDRNSMACSVESRVPFLDLPLVAFAASLPEEHLVGDDGSSKRLLRAALRGIVPDAVLDRRDKIGFATPEAAWLRQRPDLLRAAITRAGEVPCLDHDGVAALLEGVLTGRRPAGHLAWRLVNFIRWRTAP